MNNEIINLAHELTEDVQDIVFDVRATTELQKLISHKLYDFDANTSSKDDCRLFIESVELCVAAVLQRMLQHQDKLENFSDKCLELSNLAKKETDNG